ncbi:putative 1,3-beta-glucan synthase component bgs4 [Cocos nucifera]|nr:putative 1,3-beta-glucan synthase component bgs4 [Cocos nucifera]
MPRLFVMPRSSVQILAWPLWSTTLGDRTARVAAKMEEDGMKTRSFRDEGYNSRRVFLRSYPLQWEEEEGREGEEQVVVSKVSLKSRLIAIFEWGEGKLLLLRRLKNKVVFYLVACHPYGFKSSKMLTV